MKQLRFTTRVLGKDAAERLKKQQVTQTLRSRNSSIIQAIFEYNIPGYLIDIILDGNSLGVVRFEGASSIILDDLSIDDARRGGFDSISELAIALKRAGYRFKPIDQYKFYRIQFSWITQ